ncbi:MAG: Na/Pi cotransporter family protein [Bacteroidetes bacterium]|nr:Na/Pi cotransporter family protein [Bacteroidota bacterium]HET6245326.1 Na/Pi cotransporter family protein [Bacteroidia bacterium]
MDYGFLDFLQLLGALCVFIFGMKVMSDGIQKAAGEKMRSILSGMTSNRFMGVFTGFLITVLLQTSSGTTVMVVSFVNAGLLTLAQSMGVIMGANVGTTLTAWMISYFGFKVNILSVAMPLMGIALPFYFHKNSTYRSIAEFVIGFGLLFIGIDFLKESVPDIKSNPDILSFIQEYTQYGFSSILLFVLFGTILTVVVQSSSAATAITLALIAQGYIDFPIAAAIFLGENIGTTVTANLAAIVGNVHAKRAARFHFLFNIFGVIWVLAVFSYILNFIDWFLVSNFQLSPFSTDIAVRQQVMVFAIAIFHSLFNLMNVALFIGFIPLLEKLVIKVQPSKGVIDEEYRLEYIGTGLLNTSELSILEARKEIVKYGLRTQRMFGFIPELLQEQDKEKFESLLSRTNKYEEICDSMELEIANFLIKVSQEEMSEEGSHKVRSMLRVISNMEKIADICYQMSLSINRKNQDKAWFTQNQRDNLNEMFDLNNKGFEVMMSNLQAPEGKENIQKAVEVENEINNLRDRIRDEHFKSIEKGDYNIKSGLYYNSLYSSCEKLGDHLLNINEAVTGINLE